MTYLLIKSLHVWAIILWMAGVLVQSLLLRPRHAPSGPEQQTLQLLRRWDRLATAPAMLLVWITGLLLAAQGGWFGNRWLSLKLVIVVALSAMHGVLAGHMRALSESRSPRGALQPQILLFSLFTMIAAIVSLVIVKPF
ncbi:MAG TPA: CopD family protein [Steroidobacter sp.]|uniref:CopD family protein n=1 Tax=Steroidobacter sp. TaxID=1978227 RepID=UPI002EDBB418